MEGKNGHDHDGSSTSSLRRSFFSFFFLLEEVVEKLDVCTKEESSK